MSLLRSVEHMMYITRSSFVGGTGGRRVQERLVIIPQVILTTTSS